jgi:F0F1-type ATP synthase gamma subunit
VSARRLAGWLAAAARPPAALWALPASRLAAMQRADKNIDELLTTLHGDFHSLRQSSIDEELFDVISGFEALSER